MAIKSAATVEVTHEHAALVRHALIVGLAAFAEVDRINQMLEYLDPKGEIVPEWARPVDMYSDMTTTRQFAEALGWLDLWMPDENA